MLHSLYDLVQQPVEIGHSQPVRVPAPPSKHPFIDHPPSSREPARAGSQAAAMSVSLDSRLTDTGLLDPICSTRRWRPGRTSSPSRLPQFQVQSQPAGADHQHHQRPGTGASQLGVPVRSRQCHSRRQVRVSPEERSGATHSVSVAGGVLGRQVLGREMHVSGRSRCGRTLVAPEASR